MQKCLGKRPALLLVAMLTVSALAVTATAQDFNGIQIHGFGGWYYGKTDGLQFLEAKKDGNAQTAQFALNVSAKPAERLTLIAQANFQERSVGIAGIGSSSAESKVELDYAFVDFEVADRTKLRLGRVKHPWGIYGEIFDVGTARPVQHLSQAIYGGTGFTGKAYNGVGITGVLAADRAWNVLYDVYAGEIDNQYEESGLFAVLEPTFTNPLAVPQKMELRSLARDVVGTRLQLTTPLEGLTVGVSGYTGTTNITTFEDHRTNAHLGSIEYLKGPFLLRAEAAKIEVEKDVDQNAEYVEVAYRVAPKWQVVARVDNLERELLALRGSFPAPYVIPPFLMTRYRVDHQEKLVGLNYWVNPNIVLRASYSQVEGAALLYPSAIELLTFLASGHLPDNEANMFMFGAQFSF